MMNSPSQAPQLTTMSQGYKKFGLNVDAQNNIHYREWAPNAQQAYLIGDFSSFSSWALCISEFQANPRR